LVETENMDERENKVICHEEAKIKILECWGTYSFDMKSINHLERKTPK